MIHDDDHTAQRQDELIASMPVVSLCRLKAQQDSLFLPHDTKLSRVEELSIVATSAGGGEDVSQSHSEFASPRESSGQHHDCSKFIEHRSASSIHGCITRLGTRFFFIQQRHSWSPLQISYRLFMTLILETIASAQFLECLIYFGSRRREVEIVPPRMRFRQSSPLPSASGRRLEWIYVLRFVELNGRGSEVEPTSQWSLRQSAVYCRYDCNTRSASWLFVALSKETRRKLQSYYEVFAQSTVEGHDPAAVHCLILSIGISNWRHYAIDLASEIDEQQGDVAGATPDGSGPMDLKDCDRRQELMALEEKVVNAILAVKATTHTVATLIDSTSTLKSSEPSKVTEESNINTEALKDQLRELNLVLIHLQSMQTKLISVAQVLSGSLALRSGINLQHLAQDSAKENEEMHRLSHAMHELTKKGTQDAAAVKVLTVLTLVYLPTTVVSNFFSTSFVRTQSNGGADSAHIAITHDWWIMAASAAPLTLITLYIWLVWTRIKARERYPWWWCHRKGHGERSLDLSPTKSSNIQEINHCTEV